MFKNFYADAYFDNITDVSPSYLKEKGVSGIILDIDNTLIGHNVPVPDEKVLSHLRLFESEGLKLCVVSNNEYDRVKNFAEKIEVEYFVHKALKPRALGYNLASKEMGLQMNEIAAIGDQIFTDVWGAKRAGCFAILTKPLHSGGEGFFIALKRILEKPFLRKRGNL
ncbi:MAG: YqeG family HAD IIIA-type phosphatase [Clostridia bacterium]|nr:YqeG family HAD IIIA-type phosphatase [Clostridia bacterium]